MTEPSVKPYSPAQEAFGNVVTKVMSKMQAWIYRRSGGKYGGKFLQDTDVCLLTTTGRKSGKPRTTPLIYLEDGEDVIIVASKGGFSDHPQWYLNLRANPSARLQRGSETIEMRAREAAPEEVEQIWPRLLELYSDFDEYKGRALARDRVIPLIVLTPA